MPKRASVQLLHGQMKPDLYIALHCTALHCTLMHCTPYYVYIVICPEFTGEYYRFTDLSVGWEINLPQASCHQDPVGHSLSWLLNLHQAPAGSDGLKVCSCFGLLFVGHAGLKKVQI